MDNNIKFDIVIPTYNRSAFVEKAIESVKRQTYTDWNLYVLDNASNDDTIDVVSKHLSPNIHYVRNHTNIGMVRNWKKAITDIGDGTHVVLLSDDDELGEEFLSKAYQALDQFPDLGLYSSAVHIHNPAGVYTWMSEYIKPSGNEFESCLPGQNLHYYLGGNPISPAAIMLNKSSVKDITDADFAYSTLWGFDRYWWAQIALKNQVVFCFTPTAIYRQHAQSASSSISKNNFGQLTDSMNITAWIINTAYNFGLLSTHDLAIELDKLNGQAKFDTLCSLVLFGNKVLHSYAQQYFNDNANDVLMKASWYKKTAFKAIGLKKIAFTRMYRNRV